MWRHHATYVPQRNVSLAAEQIVESAASAARVIPHARLPMPRLEYLDVDGRAALVDKRVPEPAALVLLSLGVLGAFSLTSRKRSLRRPNDRI